MIDQQTQVTPIQPLSEFHLEMLSQNAVKLYQAVWSRMSRLSTTVVVLNNAEASRRSRVLMLHLGAAQSELASANLFLMAPGGSATRYEFVADPGATEPGAAA